ncbi:phage tail sheath family protein [Pelagibius marinus]|uniref:phage tail sheath family protein n=1 Tax=Pelagibius marinus TaxID=2762760 RepID=UPI001872B21E|nr:phage tail sheath family protein [Pelagibius marinus]
MPEYLAPGVYVEEIPSGTRPIESVATALPVFIGYTETARGAQGEDLTGRAVEITSMQDYQARFGKAPIHPVTLTVEKRIDARGRLLDVEVDWPRRRSVPRHFMNYALQLYFRNGGGRCLIYSLGRYGRARADDFRAALTALEKVEGPTLLVLPDAVKLDDADYAAVLKAALDACAKTRDRFTIAEVPGAVPGGNDDLAAVEAGFRDRLTGRGRRWQFGAAYFPYLESRLPLRTVEAQVTLKRFDVVTVAKDGRERRRQRAGAAGRRLNDRRLALAQREPEVYSALRRFLGRAYAILPPSGAVAGLYVRTDATRGVWKAPAGADALAGVGGPAVAVGDSFQDALNVDPAGGKSVNAIRKAAGRGTLVWGARTLAGNDNEYRYVNVRRFFIFLEQSIDRGTQWAVFEPNGPATWARVKVAIETFLYGLWRQGAFQGAKPEEAFTVAVGLGETMTRDDVLKGRLVVQVGVAPLRPAEFVILRFTHKVRAP